MFTAREKPSDIAKIYRQIVIYEQDTKQKYIGIHPYILPKMRPSWVIQFNSVIQAQMLHSRYLTDKLSNTWTHNRKTTNDEIGNKMTKSCHLTLKNLQQQSDKIHLTLKNKLLLPTALTLNTNSSSSYKLPHSTYTK